MVKTRRECGLRGGGPGGLRLSCRLVSSRPPPLPWADGTVPSPARPSTTAPCRSKSDLLSAGSSACSSNALDLDLLPPFQTPLRVAEKARYVARRVLLCQIHCASLPYAAFQQPNAEAVPIAPHRHILAVPMQGTQGSTPANANNASKQPFLYAKQCGETRKT
jgi:hypothetical protein